MNSVTRIKFGNAPTFSDYFQLPAMSNSEDSVESTVNSHAKFLLERCTDLTRSILKAENCAKAEAEAAIEAGIIVSMKHKSI